MTAQRGIAKAMPRGNCRDCQYWQLPGDAPYPDRPGFCWWTTAGDTPQAARFSASLAVVGPQPGLLIGQRAPHLWTAPTFGCVQYVPLPE